MRISDWSSDVCSSDLKSVGIATVVWSYPRGGNLSKEGELALDVGAYAAHIAALIGAHIIKVKLPRSEEHTSELQSLMRISYAVFCLKKKNNKTINKKNRTNITTYRHRPIVDK